MHEDITRFTTTARRTRIALAVSLALVAGIGSASAAPAPGEAGSHWPALRASILARAKASGHLDAISPGQTVPGSAPAATIPVSNCANAGPGSLRAAVDFASSGDTIDISGLNCQIKLSSSIVTTADTLTIKGNPDTKYAISGENSVRPLTHNGTGTLVLDGVGIAFGKATGSTAEGGCIRSSGDVHLTNSSQAKYCVANAGDGVAHGGAIFSEGHTTITQSAVTNSKALGGMAQGGGIYATGGVTLSGAGVAGNSAGGANSIYARGGGVFSKDALSAKYSVFDDNAVISAEAGAAGGGGVWTEGDANFIGHSTFSNNRADGAAALMVESSSSSTSLSHTTFADNESLRSGEKYAGAITTRGDLTISNSTISGNSETNADDAKYGAGIATRSGAEILMTSTIVAGNSLRLGELWVPSNIGGESDAQPARVAGSRNLIGTSQATEYPGDTIVSNAPLLGPLQDNGGVTYTMALLHGSPAIDKGSSGGSSFDQRGSGFPRVVGPAADIGAFESNDMIFANGFD